MEYIHVWEKKEIILYASKQYDNPYTEATVWADLEGPSFSKRVYGFRDGDNIFKVRIAPVSPGQWKWTSGSSQDDNGLNNKT